jgi:ComF family protein
LREWLRGLLDLLLPPACARCDAHVASGEPLCRTCAARVARVPRAGCARCQEPVTREPLCPTCRTLRSPLATCVGEVWFEGDAADWIHRFKYPAPGIAGLDAAPLEIVRSWALAAAARLPEPPPDAVVPIPLHRSALRRRGFNPAAGLARAVARQSGVPLAAMRLARVRATESQTGLDRAARRRNVRGAFRARRAVSGHVWLVDDVVTTGATLAEAARVLRRAGARRVSAVCAARTRAPTGHKRTPRSSDK